MRLAELSRLSGVSTATIKYYLREGLLPAGTAITRTQAEYDQAHLQRLRLIRTLREIGGLSVASIADIVTHLDDERSGLPMLFGSIQTAIARTDGDTPASSAGQRAAAKLIRDLGWKHKRSSPLPKALARLMDTLIAEDFPTEKEGLSPWIDAARSVAEVEVGTISAETDRSEAAYLVTVGVAVLGELLTLLRLMAQEDITLRRFG